MQEEANTYFVTDPDNEALAKEDVDTLQGTRELRHQLGLAVALGDNDEAQKLTKKITSIRLQHQNTST